MNNRFEFVKEEVLIVNDYGHHTIIAFFRDKVTGVYYISQNMDSITPLVDADGKPLTSL